VLLPASTLALEIEAVKSRESRVLKKWKIDGEPRGVAVAPDGTIYVGLAAHQSVLALDPDSGRVLRHVVLDDEEIAATKELVSLRINKAGDRLVIANGSDESVTILSLPDLGVVREILLEGEVIRDAIPDPAGKHLFVLGRRVYVYDADGATRLRVLDGVDPMAIAVTSDGSALAVITRDEFPSGSASMVAIFETATFREVMREPLQTDREIQAALFAADDKALMVLASDWLAEKQLVTRPGRLLGSAAAGQTQLRFSFSDFVSSEAICLPEKSGPQIASLGRESASLLFGERRCSNSGTLTANPRRVSSASVYGVEAWAVAYDRKRNAVVVSDPAGFLTMYRVPLPPRR
jgi:hypothetical protein